MFLCFDQSTNVRVLNSRRIAIRPTSIIRRGNTYLSKNNRRRLTSLIRRQRSRVLKSNLNRTRTNGERLTTLGRR